MRLFYDENPTKRSIILLLKKSGGMTIDELCRDINVTPMGIRQHLISLEKKGLATFVTKKQGIGRPSFIFQLTKKADELFPKTYDSFAVDMLRDIKRNDGSGKIDELFRWRKERLYELRKEALSDREDLDGMLNGLADILRAEGNCVELNRNNGSYHLLRYNCPISKIAYEFKNACEYELELYRDLTGKDITRTHSASDGGATCLFVIPSV